MPLPTMSRGSSEQQSFKGGRQGQTRCQETLLNCSTGLTACPQNWCHQRLNQQTQQQRASSCQPVIYANGDEVTAARFFIRCSPNAAAALLRKMAGFRLTLGSFMILGSSSMAKGSTCMVTSCVRSRARPAAHHVNYYIALNASGDCTTACRGMAVAAKWLTRKARQQGAT